MPAQAWTLDGTDPGPQPGPELFVLLNPGSGPQDAAASRATLARVFEDGGRQHRFVPVERAQDLAAAADQAGRAAATLGGALVAVGGDGTLGAVAQAAWRHGCPLGVLPRGTFNLFGRDLGISRDLEAAARGLLLARPQPLPVAQVNGRLFLVNASLGLYPQLLEDREAFKQQLGRHRWVALAAGCRTLLGWRRQFTLAVEIDGQRTMVRTPTLFVGSNRLQLQLLGVPEALLAQLDGGALVALVLRPVGVWRLLGLALRGAIGRLAEAESVDSFAFHALDVQVLRTRKLKVAADGEVDVLRPPLRFEQAPRPLQLLVPPRQARVPRA